MEYLEEEAMPPIIDQYGNRVHPQPIDTHLKRLLAGMDKEFLKQRIIMFQSAKRIKTRKDIITCLTEAVEELRLSREQNLDPSRAYPNTMAHLNADRYAIQTSMEPGIHGPDSAQGIATIVEDTVRSSKLL